LDLDTGNKFLASAVRLQRHGFRVFPIAADTKDVVLIKEYADYASADPERASAWWRCPLTKTVREHNIGITCHSLRGGGKIVGVDIDNKQGKDGDLEVLKLELEGKELPDTFEQTTPTGGRHLVYKTDAVLGNSTSKIADGIDIRGRGGYLIGAGSELEGKPYVANFAPLAQAPDWLVQACLATKPQTALSCVSVAEIDPKFAYKRAEEHVKNVKGAEQGTRNTAAFELAARLKDFGLSSYCTLEVMEEWADRCLPPMPEADLLFSIENAYKYGKNAQGVYAPENAFDEIEMPVKVSPIQQLNKSHAFVLTGGGHHILWEKTDHKGKDVIEHLNEESFHKKFAARTMVTGGGKLEPVTKAWMKSVNRRSYDGICFSPEQPTPPGYYNLWKGFAYKKAEPLEVFPEEATKALQDYLDHARENICAGDEKLFHWLMGYFAHLIQRPWESPGVAIVLRGSKGVGKNVLVRCVGKLLGGHYLVAAKERYLTGDFNSHFENCLFFVLDEALWGGDKRTEGTLKDLITGDEHLIEHKGKEAYRVDNCTRVMILGNENWLVPASHDERRYGVFDVGDGRKQDIGFFKSLLSGMDLGGYRLLLTYLSEFDISAVDVRRAPNTKGLLEQKMQSLGPVQEWWFECLTRGELTGSGANGWPDEVAKDGMRTAFGRYCRDRQIRTRVPEERGFGKIIKQCCASVKTDQKTRAAEGRSNSYRLPPHDRARADFEAYIGHEVDWE